MVYKPEKSKSQKETKDISSKIKRIQIIPTGSKENTAIRFILPNNLQCFLPRDMASQEIKIIIDGLPHIDGR